MPASLQLDGTVIDMGGEVSGTMTIRVGDQVTTAPVALPDYSVSIHSPQPGAMVSIEIEAPGVKYASILGTYRKLAGHAGADARLTVAELDRLRLSPISTALHFFLRHELDGRLPVSDIEHEEALRYVSGADLETAVGILHAFSDGSLVLPPGFANGYALLEDRAAYSDYLAQPHGLAEVPGADARKYSFYFAHAPSIPLQGADIGRTVLLAGPLARDEAIMTGPAVQVMVSTPDGYDIHAGRSRRNASFARELVSGDLGLIPRGEVYTEQYVSRFVEEGQPTTQVLERRTLMGSVLRRHFAGARYSLWVEIRQEWLTYPEFPAHPPEFATSTALWVGSELDTLSGRYRSGELVGARALPVFCKQGAPVTLVSCEYALHKVLANGTGRTENVGPKVDADMLPIGALGGDNFQWRSSTRHSFRIDYPGTSATYWRIHDGDGASDLLAYVATAQDGNDTLTLAGTTPMLIADGTSGFDEVTPEGSWRYATFKQSRAAYAYDEMNFPWTTVFHRYVDGTAVQAERSDLPQFSDFDTDYRSSWQLLDGRLYDTRYRANASTGLSSTLYFSSCAQAFARGATECTPRRVRYFRPLARVGDRLYGIEDLYDNLSNEPAPFEVTRYSRGTYHEKL